MLLNTFISKTYKGIYKPILFKQDPEDVHDRMSKVGNRLGKHSFSRSITKKLFEYKNSKLKQSLFNTDFKNPIGLSAGFDYDAHMTGIMPSVGFAFESMGTVTYNQYVGNPKPRLARLPKSKSLLVNKGFKSVGIKEVLNNNVSFVDDGFNLGISIGATNSSENSSSEMQIKDIISSFRHLLQSNYAEQFAYYELNISCPNILHGAGSLAQPQTLDEILSEIRKLGIKKPLFVKFQLEIEWSLAKELVQIMVKYNVDAIILANLLKKKKNFEFDSEEINNIIDNKLLGNFSGKSTQELSNDLIYKVYAEFGDQIKIIGVGGVFNALDAYEKIKRGASLVQMITGMIFEGPQVIGSINRDLVKLLEKDGYSNISEAIGAYHRN